MASQPQPVKSLKELAAAAVAKIELEQKSDLQVIDDLREFVNVVKVEVKKQLDAKGAVKETDAAKAVNVYKQTLQLLDKRTNSWTARVDEMRRIAPQVKSDPAAAATWSKIKEKAEQSAAKYNALDTALKALQKDLQKAPNMQKMISCTTLISKVMYLREKITEAQRALLP